MNEGNTMKKILIATLSALVLVVGGSAAGVSAQADPVVTVDKAEVEPGGEVVVNVSGAEADSPILVEIGEATGEGTADVDGNADIPVTIPANVELGELDGIVNINGVDFPVSVVVAAAAAAEAEAEGTGDGTPQPTAVNTGDGSSSSSNSMTLFAAAAGLLVIGGGAMTIRRRSAMS
jgi:MYXO-CTERM domain-containing protein